MEQKKNILVIDDDRNICELIRIYLEKEGYNVDVEYDGIKGLALFKRKGHDLIILDLLLPGMDGLQVCREVRNISKIPIIMLSAKGETFDKVLGLELGADDYMVKPFETKELVARIKAVLRRFKQDADESEEIVYPGLIINKSNYTVKLDGKNVEMTPKELETLFFLASNPNKVYTRDQLLEQIWEYDFFGDARTIDVHIKRIREKIFKENAPWELKTVWGVGYKFETK
jgi:DNA-binding response OmpR family regulator